MAEDRGAPSGSPPQEPPVTPAPQAPVLSEVEKQDKAFQADVSKANNPKAIRELTQAAMKKAAEKPAPPAEEKPAEGTPPAAPAEGAPVEGDGTVETPAEGEGAPAEEVPPAEGEAEDEPEEGEEVKPIDSKKARITPREDDQVGRLALSYQRRNRDWSLEDAIAAARKQLGLDKPAEQKPAADPNKPETIDATTARIADLRAQRRTATTSLEFEKVAELNDQLEDLILHKSNLERAGEREQQAQLTRYERDFASSERQAAELYPSAGDPNSAFAKRMIEIENTLEETQDPLYNEPEKPLRIAQMVAREMNIAPRKKGAPAPAKPATPPAQPAGQKKGVLPGGGSRTTPPATPSVNADTAKFTGIKTLADLRKVQKELGIQT